MDRWKRADEICNLAGSARPNFFQIKSKLDFTTTATSNFNFTVTVFTVFLTLTLTLIATVQSFDNLLAMPSAQIAAHQAECDAGIHSLKVREVARF